VPITITNNTKALVYFFLINFAISVFHIDSWNNANTTSRVLPIVSYFENGTFQIDKYHQLTPDKAKIGRHYYSDKAPLPTLMIIPVFGLLKSIGIITSNDGSFYGESVYILGALICGVIPFVLILCLTFIRLRRNNLFSLALLSTLPFYASFIFIYAGTFYNHIISAFFLLLGYIFVKDKKYILAGVFSGLAFLCEYLIAIFIVIWILQILLNERKLKPSFLFGIGVIPAIIFILFYNYHFTGSAFTMLYKYHTFSEMHVNYGFNAFSLKALWGLVFGSYRGMFLYTPILFLILYYSLRHFYLKTFRNVVSIILSNYVLLPSILVILTLSFYFGWWGGWTFGPRYILFVTVLLLFEGLFFVSRLKFSNLAFWSLIFVGLILTFSAKITVLYSIPSEIQFPLTDLCLIALKSFEFNNCNILTYCFGINPVIANIIWMIISGILLYLLSNLQDASEVN